MYIRSLVCSIGALLSLNLFAGGELDTDPDILAFEQNKQLPVITTTEKEQEYDALCRAISEEDAGIDAEDYDTYNFFDDDDYAVASLPSASPEAVVDESEQYIVEKIKSYVKSNPFHACEIKQVINDYIARCNEREAEVLAVDVSIAIAQHFRRQADVKTAQRFFRLATVSARGYEDYVYLELGEMFLEYVNRVINDTQPVRPTAEIFSALSEAIRYNSYDQSGAEPFSLGDARNRELIKHRDRMVRWAISPAKVLHDRYFGANVLANKLYARDFVERLLEHKDLIAGLWERKSFNASNSKSNIFAFLENRGFVGVRGFYAGAPQYVLVNDKGFIVRVKRNAVTQKWEFTVGLSLKNPVLWNSQGNALRAVYTRDLIADGTSFMDDARSQPYLADVQGNEVAKVVFDNGFIQVIPPGFSTFKYWWTSNQPVQQLMNEAHRPMNTVGKFLKKTGRYDYSDIDSFCIWK